jgi:TIR domain
VTKIVFISYRREDTASAAGRVYDRLCQILGKRHLFFDVSAIKGGEDFEEKIASAIARSDAVLIQIGKHWLDPQRDNKPRLFNSDDYVRAEVRAALNRNVLVLPVLVDGAQMPAAPTIPEDIAALCTKNAVPLRHESFDDDVENILRTIFGAAGKERPWETRGRLLKKVLYSAMGAIAGLLCLMLVALAHYWIFARPLSVTIGSASTTLLLIAAGAIGAWLGFQFEARRRKKFRD